MPSTRRIFLAAAGAVAAAAVTKPLEATVSVITGKPKSLPGGVGVDASLYDFTPQMFQGLLGSRFSVSDPKLGTAQVKLIAVGKVPPVTAALAGQPSYRPAAFSLRFQSISGAVLPQGTYTFKSTSLGSFPLLVVPSAATTNRTYTAIINRF